MNNTTCMLRCVAHVKRKKTLFIMNEESRDRQIIQKYILLIVDHYI